MYHSIKVITQSLGDITPRFQFSNEHFECSQAIVHRTMKEWKLFIFMDNFTFMKFFALHTCILTSHPSV